MFFIDIMPNLFNIMCTSIVCAIWMEGIESIHVNSLLNIKPPTHSIEEFRRMIIKLDRFNSLQSKIMGVNNRFFDDSSSIDIERIVAATPEQIPFFFEGDILLTDQQLDELIEYAEYAASGNGISNEIRREKRTMIRNERYRWKEFPITYFVNTSTGIHVPSILNGIDRWEKETCLTFKRITDNELETIRLLRDQKTEECIMESSNITNQTSCEFCDNSTLSGNTTDVPENCTIHWEIPYNIEFIKGMGCYSNVGNISRNGQIVSIGAGCTVIGTVTHEIGHALGLYHEQSRPDRNRFVTVEVASIVRSYLGQFSKGSWRQINTYGVPYDYGSVMHYGSDTFSDVNNRMMTLRTTDEFYQNTIGQRSYGPSFSDVKKMNLAYCANVCNTSLPCKNDGYVDPKNCEQCRCPRGFGGKFCEVATVKSHSCGEIDLQATEEFQEISKKGSGGCNWVIKVPSDKIILFEITTACFTRRSPCSGDYLEIKYRKDMGDAGARLCGRYPSAMTTHSNRLVVIYRGAKHSSFNLSFKMHESTLPIVPTLSNETSIGCERTPISFTTPDTPSTTEEIIESSSGFTIDRTPTTTTGDYELQMMTTVEELDGSTGLIGELITPPPDSTTPNSTSESGEMVIPISPVSEGPIERKRKKETPMSTMGMELKAINDHLNMVTGKSFAFRDRILVLLKALFGKPHQEITDEEIEREIDKLEKKQKTTTTMLSTIQTSTSMGEIPSRETLLSLSTKPIVTSSRSSSPSTSAPPKREMGSPALKSKATRSTKPTTTTMTTTIWTTLLSTSSPKKTTTTTTKRSSILVTTTVLNCSAWPRCSSECGGCGTRQRICNRRLQRQICNLRPCARGVCCRSLLRNPVTRLCDRAPPVRKRKTRN